jgi:hypothetical protein
MLSNRPTLTLSLPHILSAINTKCQAHTFEASRTNIYAYPHTHTVDPLRKIEPSDEVNSNEVKQVALVPHTKRPWVQVSRLGFGAGGDDATSEALSDDVPSSAVWMAKEGGGDGCHVGAAMFPACLTGIHGVRNPQVTDANMGQPARHGLPGGEQLPALGQDAENARPSDPAWGLPDYSDEDETKQRTFASAVMLSWLMSNGLDDAARRTDKVTADSQRTQGTGTQDASAQADFGSATHKVTWEHFWLISLARWLSQEAGVSLLWALMLLLAAMLVTPAFIYLEVLHRWKEAARRDAKESQYHDDDADERDVDVRVKGRKGGMRGGKNLRRRKEAISRQNGAEEGGAGQGSIGDMDVGTSSASKDVLRIGRLEVFKANLLGSGSHGTQVYLGRLDQGRVVAVKRLLKDFFHVRLICQIICDVPSVLWNCHVPQF